MLHKVVVTVESVNEILKCDHSNENYWAVLSCGAVSVMLHKVVLDFESVKYFPVVLFIMLNKVVLT